MPAGTIALTNNSTAVTGTGTSFTTELKANDFVVAVVGGVAYTLGIKSVDSNAALTLAQAYTGPAASGLAWTPVPFGTMTAITAQLAAQVTYAVRGFNLDKANWQQVYSASGNITVTLPDGSQYSGPSWNSVAGSVTGKMDKSQNLNDLSDKSAAWLNLINARTPTAARKDLGLDDTASPTFAAVNTATWNIYPAGGVKFRYAEDGTRRYVVLDNALIYPVIGYRTAQGSAGAGGINAFNFYWTGSQLQAYIDSSNVGNVSLASTSDKGLKKDIKYRSDASEALAEVMQWRPADFKMKARGIIPETENQLGFIANDLVTVSPECVSGKGLPDDYNIEADPNNDTAYYLNHIPMIAKLAQALQAQQKIIDSQSEIIKAMGIRLKDLDGLDG
ncbi:MAG: tail fiber domain-containing protein [Pantoea agglomerans]